MRCVSTVLLATNLGAAVAFYPAPLPLTSRSTTSIRERGDVKCFFDLFGGGKKAPAPLSQQPEAAAPAPTKKRVAIPDKGPKLPTLFNAWFDGSLSSMFNTAVKAAVKDGIMTSEALFPALPNMEEKDFGTRLNQLFVQDVSKRLKGQENILRKQSVTAANIDYGNRLAASLGNKKTYIMTFDNAVSPSQVTLNKNAEFLTVNQGIPADASANDLILTLSPCVQNQWDKSASLGSKGSIPVVALNAPFSLNYDIAQGGKWEPIFIVKRVTKGWIFRAYPGPFKAYLDTPKGTVELIKVWPDGEVPKLREVSALVRAESDARGYAILNDRYLTQRL